MRWDNQAKQSWPEYKSIQGGGSCTCMEINWKFYVDTKPIDDKLRIAPSFRAKFLCMYVLCTWLERNKFGENTEK